jgi:uncharacterized protein YndB with AHSA1/START domain
MPIMSEPNAFEMSATIRASAMHVLFAFLDATAIKTWWGAKNVVVQPRPGGLYVVEWTPGENDDVLGPQGGVLAGFVDNAQAGHFLRIGNLHWMTPRGDVFGPTRIEVNVFSKGDPRRSPTLLRLGVEGFQSGPQWDRYRQRAERAWQATLPRLTTYCESQAPAEAEPVVQSLGDTFLAEAVLQGRRMS